MHVRLVPVLQAFGGKPDLDHDMEPVGTAGTGRMDDHIRDAVDGTAGVKEFSDFGKQDFPVDVFLELGDDKVFHGDTP